MLETRERQTYLDSLKPPEGFLLDRAVATTFSLDLTTLLVLPLSFARFEIDHALEALQDPLILLDTLKDYGNRLTVFCQQGQIHVPAFQHLLFSYLEPMVIEARAPNADGLFHAKTWLMRFVHPDDEKVLYRFICLSKNLTTTPTWDTALTIEGELQQHRIRGFSRSHPLGDFYAALPELATRPLSEARQNSLKDLQEEVRRTPFKLRYPFDEDGYRFWPLGISGHVRSPFWGRMDRALIISPFLSASLLKEISEPDRGDILVSRSHSLADLDGDCLARFGQVYVLDEQAEELDAIPAAADAIEHRESEVIEEDSSSSESDSSESDDLLEVEDEETSGSLHAKLFVTEQGWDARLWTGSANATVPAMPHVGGHGGSVWGRNVEFLVEVRGKKSVIGIDKILGTDEDEKSLRNLLYPYRAPEESSEEDAVCQELEEKLEALRRRLLDSGFQLTVVAREDSSLYDLVLTWNQLPELPSSLELVVWPVTQKVEKSRSLHSEHGVKELQFENLSALSLTSFLAFELRAEKKDIKAKVRFVLNLPVKGMPENRGREVLKALLADREKFMRYLLMILGEERSEEFLGSMRLDGRDWGSWQSSEFIPLFEELVRAIARNPEKIDRIESILADLRETEDGLKVLPEGFELIWEPIWEARRQEA